MNKAKLYSEILSELVITLVFWLTLAFTVTRLLKSESLEERAILLVLICIMGVAACIFTILLLSHLMIGLQAKKRIAENRELESKLLDAEKGILPAHQSAEEAYEETSGVIYTIESESGIIEVAKTDQLSKNNTAELLPILIVENINPTKITKVSDNEQASQKYIDAPLYITMPEKHGSIEITEVSDDEQSSQENDTEPHSIITTRKSKSVDKESLYAVVRVSDSNDKSLALPNCTQGSSVHKNTAALAHIQPSPYSFSFPDKKICQITNPSEVIGMQYVVVLEVSEQEKRNFSELMGLFETTTRDSHNFWKRAKSKNCYEFRFLRPLSNWYLVEKVADLKGLESKNNTKIYLSISPTEELKKDMKVAERRFEDSTTISVLFPTNKAPLVRISSCENQRSNIISKIYNDYFLRGDQRGDEFFQRYADLLSSCILMHHDSTEHWMRRVSLKSRYETRDFSREYQKQIEKDTTSLDAPVTESLAISMGYDIVNNLGTFRKIIRHWQQTNLTGNKNRSMAVRVFSDFIKASDKFSLKIPECYNTPSSGFIKFILSTMSSPIKLPEFFVQGPKLEDVMTTDIDYLFACFDPVNGKIFADALEKKNNKQGTCLYILSLLLSYEMYDEIPDIISVFDEDINNVWIAAFLLSSSDRENLPGQGSPIFFGCRIGFFVYEKVAKEILQRLRQFLHGSYQAKTVSDNDAASNEFSGALASVENAPDPLSALASMLKELAYGQELSKLLNYVNSKTLLEGKAQGYFRSVLQTLARQAVEALASNQIWHHCCKEKVIFYDFALEPSQKAMMFYDSAEEDASAISCGMPDTPRSHLSQHMLEGPSAQVSLTKH